MEAAGLIFIIGRSFPTGLVGPIILKQLLRPRLGLQGFEVAFAERIVVGGMRPVVRTGYPEVGEQQCGGLGLHRAAAVCMQSELTGRHVVFLSLHMVGPMSFVMSQDQT
jgi:hypothetical protein